MEQGRWQVTCAELPIAIDEPFALSITERRRRFLLGALFAAIGATCWGFSGTCSQFLFEGYEIDAFFIISVRTAFSAACFLAVMLATKRKDARDLLDGIDVAGTGIAGRRPLDERSPRHDTAVRKARLGVRMRMVLFGAALYVSQLFYVLTISMTNAGTATVIMMLYMIFVMAYTVITTRALPSIRELLALAFAISGTVVIATQGDIRTLNLPPEGVIFGVICAIGCAGYIVIPKPLLEGHDSFVVTGTGMVVDAILAFIGWMAFCIVTGAMDIPNLDFAGVLALILGMGAIGTFGAFWMFMKGVSMVGTITGSLIGSLEPISAMAISMVWLSTPFTGADWLGLLAMMVMLVLVTVPPRKKGPSGS